MTRTPAIYLSHGAPPLADDALWTRQLAAWSAGLERPEAILVVSAHWENDPLTIGATRTVPLVYDFWGFPQHYYDVTYPAPGAPGLAADVARLLPGVHHDPGRGLDHGAYVPLKEMFPEADIPVLQMSMPTLDPAELYGVGKTLAPLRDQGVLIVGSGFTTHNLRGIDPGLGTDEAPAWSREFDHWTQEAVTARDVDALLDFQRKAPAAHIAHPRTEHYAPLFVALGAAEEDDAAGHAVIDGYWYGLAKRSFQFG
ncbi:dioxygenase [Actinorhabdospora filicis]|uniref:Dioxygenase n=1 Tax=Actinorhabdospora filicis TaxID=1785913 RepID=A0A9W6SMY6_9ACTN|nr:class III extradiol ring-cleavage dioxygenase [Actinorhabdospora filicis]GLZ78804.1 dioxygenase [Actinorhabdospora filicis]